MANKKLIFKDLNIDSLLEQAATLPTNGRLAASPNHLTYLNVDNGYIHQLFPLIKAQEEAVLKPAYFGLNLAGAHISVIYPEERTFVAAADLDKEHHFRLKGAYSADLDDKRYYVLTVEAESLLELRLKYDLPLQLYFKDHWIDLHITIATAHLMSKRGRA